MGKESTDYKVTLLGPSMVSYLYDQKHTSENDLLLIDTSTEIDLQKLVSYHVDSNIKIGLILNEKDRIRLTQLLELDIDGYFLIDMETEEINAGISIIEKGYTYIHPKITTFLHQEYLKLTKSIKERPEGLLTNREWQVLEEIAKGNSNELIAENLLISDKTVKNHVASLLRKFRVSDRTSAVVHAIKNGYL